MFKYQFVGSILFLLILQRVSLNAQISEHSLKDSISSASWYMGLYSRILIPSEDLRPVNTLTGRIGSEVIFDVSSAFQVKSLGALQLNSNGPILAIATFEGVTSLARDWQLTIGLFPGPISRLRPKPVSWQSQTELYTQSRRIGAKPGLALTYGSPKTGLLSYGLIKVDELWANQFRLHWKGLDAAGYYQGNGEFFIATNFTRAAFKLLVNYSSIEEEYTLGAFVPVGEQWVAYLDVNYWKIEANTSLFRLGIRRHFENPSGIPSGFLATEWDFQTRNFTVQLFVFMN
ncbi:MAG: hypothetical protein KTR30_16080 [Saprospiraceae bacterium]|nr:hypothetical protein [Saprospiraceae bacterium]